MEFFLFCIWITLAFISGHLAEIANQLKRNNP